MTDRVYARDARRWSEVGPHKLQVIVGGQAGSEGKGAVAGHLAREMSYPLCIRVAGPNAGHSVVNPLTGVKHALRHIPVGAVTNPDAWLAIAAGSEIDYTVLRDEIDRLEQDKIDVRGRLAIDPSATLLEQHHIDQEREAGLVGRIGSTGKGIGAARAARIMRTARRVGDMVTEFDTLGRVIPVAQLAAARGGEIQVEGTQGYLLGLHHRFYPKVTSSDCTALDFLQMARLNPWAFPDHRLEIWVVLRPYPIRVAGDSGPLSGETSWEALGLPVEKTTVTQKIRRVGHWDPDLVREAVAANGLHLHSGYANHPDSPIRLALTMADQIDPALAGATDVSALIASNLYQQWLLSTFHATLGTTPDMVTTSDRTYLRPRSVV